MKNFVHSILALGLVMASASYKFALYILALGFVTAAVSCRKDTVVFIPQTTVTIVESDTSWDANLSTKSNLSIAVLPPLSIEKLVDQLSADPIKDTCNAERGGTITVPNNVTVTIPATACNNPQGRPCTGRLDVEILILRKKGDFIAYNLPTSSGNKQLISGGAVSVIVKQNGQPVTLASGKTIKVHYLMTEPDNLMQLFLGKTDGRFTFDWIPIPAIGSSGVGPKLTTWVDSTQRNKGYDMVLDRFGLINCDRFGGDSTSFNTKFTVTLPNNFTNVNTSVYVAFKNLNSVLALVGDSHTKAFVPTGRGLPVGRAVTIVVLGYVKDKFYFVKQDVTIENPTGTAVQAIRLTPTAVEKDEIKDMLNSL